MARKTGGSGFGDTVHIPVADEMASLLPASDADAARWFASVAADRQAVQLDQRSHLKTTERPEGSRNYVFLHTSTIGYAVAGGNRLLWGIDTGCVGEGYVGYLHGGFIASVLDQAMATCLYYFLTEQPDQLDQGMLEGADHSVANIPKNQRGFATASLKVKYYRPVPLHSLVLVDTRVTSIQSRKITVETKMFNRANKLVSEGNSLFSVMTWSKL